MCNNDNCNCISEILNTINILQNNAECGDACLDTCDRGFLGCGTPTFRCNTRPIMLYTCSSNGTPWQMPTTKEPTTGETLSSVFRIEKLDGCCATFRVLEPNEDTTSLSPYVATNVFFTMNLGCCCVLRCLNDTYVENI